MASAGRICTTEIFIIEGSVLDNIALGQPHPNRNRVTQILDQVQLKEWADELPQGLDTPLGEYGSRLSGGQKQRIGIARALYKGAEVLFFDEATSALDNQTEHEINCALEDLSVRCRQLTLLSSPIGIVHSLYVTGCIIYRQE